MTSAKHVKTALIDLSGTIHVDDKIIPGAVEALERLVLDGALLVAIHKARYYRTNDGLALGPGPFVRALEFATDKTAEIVGKPDKTFFLTALRQLHARPEDTVMIGDDVRDDIDGAQQVGIRGILVQTGKYMVGDEIKIENRPWALVPSFVDAVDMILKSKR
ncbi:hypothetical protein HPB52_011201 [Rhipicephalus sanguineus]|uniref:Phospholysine phosphohistidine inorganic pyrophosphate phosphatase n=1 Tax=Rhipicephalus sanguineus TaxID=34632 RepID=A0A9D4PRE2_RHISA|nr:hypothetical protein HPB52_011201 [Rhipicephalus sanguineus]